MATANDLTQLAETLARLAQALAEREPEPAPPQQARQMPDRVLLTVEEAAKRLGIGKTKAYELVKSGAIESVQIGRLRRVHVDAVNAYAAALVSAQRAA